SYAHHECPKAWQDEGCLYLLDVWRESPLYSERERAVLDWTEALTLMSETHTPDDVYRALPAPFTEEEQAMLPLLIIAINGWNRIQVDFRLSGRRAPGGLMMSSQGATTPFDARPKVDGRPKRSI